MLWRRMPHEWQRCNETVDNDYKTTILNKIIRNLAWEFVCRGLQLVTNWGLITQGVTIAESAETTRRPASADRTARSQFQAGSRGDVGL